MTPAAARARLFALPRWTDAGASAYRPGLDRMRALLAAAGDPQRGRRVVHVAGTNGKGSTASMAAAVLTASGRRVGLHTSPHLVDVTERMRVDGAPAADDWLADAVARLAPHLDTVGPSFFEATVALSLLFFAEQSVDVAVVEVGLGGRLDATNAVEPTVSVVTHVGLDHTELLGDTKAAIAREKAGIARPGVPLLHAVADADAARAVEAEASRRGAPVENVRATCRAPLDADGRLHLATPVRDYGAMALGLPGAHQAWNAALAVRAAEIVAADLTPAAVASGLADVARLAGLRGRGEAHASDPRVALDVAHNADGWAAALAAVRVPEGGRLWALVGVMADKDAGALAGLLADAGAFALPAALPGDRALLPDALAAALVPAGVSGDAPASVADALARFRRDAGPADRLLVTGSHVTVAEALAVLDAAGERPRGSCAASHSGAN